MIVRREGSRVDCMVVFFRRIQYSRLVSHMIDAAVTRRSYGFLIGPLSLRETRERLTSEQFLLYRPSEKKQALLTLKNLR